MSDKEIWKIYPEYDFIEVSSLGNVRTKDHWVSGKNGSRRLIKGHTLKQYQERNGYMRVHFRVNGKTVNLCVHRMVATCFLPNEKGLPEVNHKDNDPTNNRLDNLEWCTRKYNEAYKKNFGTSPTQVLGRPVFAVDLKTGKILRFETRAEAAQQLGVNEGHICSVVKGERQQTGGYWFTENESEITEKKIQEIKASMWPRQVIAVNPETSEVFCFKSQHEAGRKLGVGYQNINSVVKDRRDKAGGYWFCYADESAVKKAREKFGDKIACKVEELLRQNQI